MNRVVKEDLSVEEVFKKKPEGGKGINIAVAGRINNTSKGSEMVMCWHLRNGNWSGQSGASKEKGGSESNCKGSQEPCYVGHWIWVLL